MANCPYAVDLQPRVGYLLCKKFMKEGVDYERGGRAYEAMCPNQELCHVTKRFKSDDNAATCRFRK